jgi:hypothetical protein
LKSFSPFFPDAGSKYGLFGSGKAKDVLSPENTISSRAPWSSIFQTSKNSNFKVPKKFKKNILI